jgi:hypothetical protein
MPRSAGLVHGPTAPITGLNGLGYRPTVGRQRVRGGWDVMRARGSVRVVVLLLALVG